MKFSKEEKEQVMKEIRKNCGSVTQELAKDILSHDRDDMPVYLVLLGIRLCLHPLKGELDAIADALFSIQKSDHMAYTVITRNLMTMFQRMIKHDSEEEERHEQN